jgi:hypothetical protein
LVALLYQPQMMGERNGAFGGIRIGRGNWNAGRTPVTIPLFPHVLTWDWTWVTAVSRWWLTLKSYIKAVMKDGVCLVQIILLQYFRDLTEATELPVMNASVCSHSWHSSFIMYPCSPTKVTAWYGIYQNFECGVFFCAPIWYYVMVGNVFAM